MYLGKTIKSTLDGSLQTQPKNIVIISSEVNIPDSLKEFVTLLEFPLPSYSEILEELNRLTASLQQKIEPSVIYNIATACQGLSLERIRRVLSKVIAQYGEINESSPTLILQEKKQIIQQTQLLGKHIFYETRLIIKHCSFKDSYKKWYPIF